MSDLEEGELESDEETSAPTPVQTGGNGQAPKPDPSSRDTFRSQQPAQYRHSKPPGLSSSDESSDSDDDPAFKKKRHQPSIKSDQISGTRAWFNPNADKNPTNNGAGQGRAPGPGFWNGEMGDVNFSRPREDFGISDKAVGAQNACKRKNNIWGSVLVEQTLSHDLGHAGVIKDYVVENDRDVESYDYMAARELEGEDSGQTGESGRRPPKRRFLNSRLGQRKYDKNKSRTHIGVSPDDLDEHVWKAITKALQEKKECLIERVVKVVGKKKALKLLYLTEDIEESGGLWTMDGSRRRTPGGVYLQLLKSDDYITKDQLKEIFLEENKQKDKERKKARAFWRKKKAEMVKKMSQTEAGEMMSDEGEANSQSDGEMEAGDDGAESPEETDSPVRQMTDHQVDNVSSTAGKIEKYTNDDFEEKPVENEDGIVISVDPYELETFS